MTTTDYRVIGQTMSRVDALDRVTGRATFGADFTMPGTLIGRIVHSPHAHAVIKRIDYSEVLKVPGVKAVITGADFPDIVNDAHVSGNAEYSIGPDNLRRLWMAREKVLFEGHPIAAIAAIDAHAADEAVRLIEVEYEVLKPAITLDQALADGAPLLHSNLKMHTLGDMPKKPSNVAQHVELGHGDVEKAFAESDVVLEN
ncbi:MAG: hypothetical protein HY261_11255 [Chloroflexi bacterium]|nr:hypothetical protein [Chloroflexota bacterium]